MSRRTWSVRAGAVTGSAHLRHGGDREDAYAVEHVGGALVVAVADGCSGARYSGLGAALAAPLAVRTARELLLARRPPQTGAGWRALLAALRDRVLDGFADAADALVATLGGTSADELATTLTAVVVAVPWVAVLAVGDGSVVLRGGGGHLDLLVAPDPPSGDSSVTEFVTTPGAELRARLIVARIPDLDAIAVCTDGMDEATLEFDGAEAVRPAASFYRRLFVWAADRESDEADLLRLLVEERIADRTEDDRTVVLAVRSG